MIKVDCPSCQASYDLDERRVPDNGMKMRCPKCSSKFSVGKDGSVSEESSSPPPPAPKPAMGQTMLGVAAPVPKAPAAPPKKTPMPAAGAFGGGNQTLIAGVAPPTAPASALGAFGGSKPRGTMLGMASKAAPGSPSDSSLPSVEKTEASPMSLTASQPGQPPRTTDGDDFGDLPAKRPTPPPTALFSMKPPSKSGSTAEVDLPAPSPRRIAPPFAAPVPLPPIAPPNASPLAAPFVAPVPNPPIAPPNAFPIAPPFAAPVPQPAAIAPAFSPTPKTVPPRTAQTLESRAHTGSTVESFDIELDLPAPKPAPIAPPFAAPNRREPRSGAPDLDLDLPAPKTADGPAQNFELGLDFPTAHSGDADLPRPVGQAGQAFAGHEDFGNLDLPTVGHNADLPALSGNADLPALSGNADLPALSGNADLPALSGNADLPALSGNADLPALSGGLDLPRPVIANLPDLDLPIAKGAADLPVPTDGQQRVDLPALSGNIDLPVPQGAIDLPSPRGAIDLPSPRGAIDLPSPRGAIDLPSPRGAIDLPSPQAAADLPMAQSAMDLPTALPGFGDLDLTLPSEPPPPNFGGGTMDVMDLPIPEAEAIDELELPVPLPTANMVTPKERTVQGVGALDPASLGNLESELPPSLMSDESSFGDIDLGEPEPEPPPVDSIPKPTSALPEPMAASPINTSLEQISAPPMGGAPGSFAPDSYGEGDFGDEDEDELYEDEDEEMEFGMDEGEDGRTFSLPPEVLRRRKGDADTHDDTKKGPRAALILGGVGALIVLVSLGGAGLGMFTHHGYFGVYFVERFLPEAATPAFAQSSIERAEKTAQSDTYADVKQSLHILGEARGKAGLNRTLLTRSLMHECLAILRFGDSSESASHAAAILRRLEERGNQAPGIALALAANSARSQKWAEAKQLLATADREKPNDPYAFLLRGEIALAKRDAKSAEAAFATALKHGGGTRAQWGLARTAGIASDDTARAAAIDATLRESPRHVEAQVADARAQWQKGNVSRALELLLRAVGEKPVDGRYVWTSARARAAAYSVIGYVQETAGRLHLARKAYESALGADTTRIEAMLGAARVMLRERRFSDALTRFESARTGAQKGVDTVVLSGRKASAEAQLGIGLTMLELDRAPDSKRLLADLFAHHPDDHEIARALGKAEQALNNVAAAEDQYRRAIALAPQVFEGYLALAGLFSREGRPDKASEVLNDAAAEVEETAEMRRMLGQAELSRNHVRGAIHEFERALELDPADLGAKFGLGQALRINGQLDAAAVSFEQIAKTDTAFAGLALERGLLREATGNYAEAIEVYSAALAKDASNIRLLLRLGAAQVEGIALDAAEQTLHKVLQEMPNSAEAEYFIGRVAFARGRTPDALTHFDRALSLDGREGEFHLYAARATLEMGNLGRTLEEAEMAIKRDPGLGDAFWVRGMVRLRMGAVRDALRDFKHANKLNPNRVEVYSGMGDCFDQMGELRLAAQAYNTALKKVPDNGHGWYRLAQIKQDAGKRNEAEKLALKAVGFGKAVARETEAPYWLGDAYRMAGDLARTRGNRKDATTRYLEYLDTAPLGHVDRRTVQARLTKWNVQWRKDDLGF